ncbi:MAG: EAL domain-containing protein [Cyanobacteria bacterium J06639_1]
MRERSPRIRLRRWCYSAALAVVCAGFAPAVAADTRSQPHASFPQPEVRSQSSRVPLAWVGGAFVVGTIGGTGVGRSLRHSQRSQAATDDPSEPEANTEAAEVVRASSTADDRESSTEDIRDSAAVPESPAENRLESADVSDGTYATEPKAAELFDILFENHRAPLRAIASDECAAPPPSETPEAALEGTSKIDRAVLHHARDAILIFNSALAVVELNPAAETLLGHSPGIAVGRDAIALLFPAPERSRSRSEARELLSNAAGAWATLRELQLQHADGSLLLLEWVSHRFVVEGEPHILTFVRDTRPYKQAEAALQAIEERYDLAVRGSNDGLWDWDLLSSRIEFSPRWKEMLGYEEREVSENPDEWFDRVHPDDRDRLVADITAHIKGETEHFESEHRILKRDRTYMWVLSRGLAVRNERNFAYRIAGSQTDITERRKAEENAYRDALSDLPNRAAFLVQLEEAVSRANLSSTYKFAVLFLDCDRFKVINDSLGHAVGDRLIQIVARRLEVCVRPLDMVARLGGDEFVVLLREIKSLDDATAIADRILQQIVQPFRIDGHEVFITASIGIVSSDIGHRRAETILRDADTAMYRAKALGKSRYVVFDESMYSGAVQRQRIESDLRRALDNREFHLAYQPIVSVETGHLSGFEALLRWKHPERDWISPAVFIPIAEDMGLISDIGEWVLQQACRQMRDWHRQFPHHPLTISVNLASNQIVQPTFVDTVRNTIAATGCDARSLRIELTESALVENMETACHHLQSLRSLGVQAYIDDFGTGYSSLSYLQTLPLDALKIDRSFISNTESQPHSWKIVETIVSLAQSLGIFTIAEGVETQEQFSRLRQLGCEYIQGYYISPPIDTSKATELIRRELVPAPRQARILHHPPVRS